VSTIEQHGLFTMDPPVFMNQPLLSRFQAQNLREAAFMTMEHSR
jgi:hypothetical protein